MKRFRFPLQPVAVLRAHRELRAREVFAAAVNACVKREEELVATRARVARFEAALADGRRGRFSPADEAQVLAAYRQERNGETAAEQAVAAAQSFMQQRRAEYLNAHRELEVVKRLEQQARVDYRAECNREEQAEFDDAAGRRARQRPVPISS